VKDISTLVDPIHELIKNDVSFIWGEKTRKRY